ncbi:uncharacterized protein LOC113798167 [Dermatophagoides pteronyssinus]|uniref:uncharacterized protein LOC113798167 n=1 Tax=Dermatophagoides pteronyssinus TaxID=6956 RepID=UPI003F6809C6
MSNNNYLYRIILFQTIFGCSYNGEYFCPNKLKTLKKYLVITIIMIQQVLYGIPSLWIWYLSATSYSADFIHNDSTVHDTMDYLSHLFHVCALVTSCFDKLTNIFRGHRIIVILNNIDTGINLSNSHRLFYYRLIYLFIISVMILYAISFSFIASTIENHSMPIVFSFTIAGIFYAINVTWLAAIYVYTAILVNERIQIYKEELPTFSNYGILLQEIIRLRDNIHHINHLSSAAMLTKTLTNGLMMATCICTFDHQLNTPKIGWLPVISTLTYLIPMFIDLSASCMASQWMHKEMGDFVRAIQERIALANIFRVHYNNYYKSHPERKQLINSNHNNLIMTGLRPIINDGEYHCLEQICMMHDSFYFTVMDTFDLKNLFMLSLASYK